MIAPGNMPKNGAVNAWPNASANVPEPAVAPQFNSAAQQDQAATFGLWIFLATELLFFGPLFFGYLYGRTHFPAAFAIASRHTDVALGTLNTAILLTSSLAMAIAVAAREAAERAGMTRSDGEDAAAKGVAARGTMASATAPQGVDTIRLSMWSLLATVVLGIAFLAVKGIEYAHEWQAHLFPGPGFAIAGAQGPGAQYFFFLYFAMTALHALHLAIGIALVAVLAIGLGRNKTSFASARHCRLAGLYWHFVDIVWVFLYPILYLVGRSSA